MTKFEEELKETYEKVSINLYGNNAGSIGMKKLLNELKDTGLLKEQQALPVVPEFVGSFLKDKSILGIANGLIPDDVISWVQEQTYYVDLEKIISHLISIKVTGFTVEKPQLFYIELPKVFGLSDSTFVSKAESGIISEFTKGKDYALKFTEQEIKAIDERYWQFAVPVEDNK